MNWRKHIVLMVGGGLALVLLVVALYFLFRLQGQFGVVNRELDSAHQRLQMLNARNPFPSEENVQKMKQNRAELQAMALQLQEQLQQNQRAPEAMEPAEFAPRLERTSRRLVQRAQESGVVLPEGFAFAFARYAAGELPAASAVPRLVEQLGAVETICDILFQARIASLDLLQRELFDESGLANETEVFENRRTTRRSSAESAPTLSQVPPAEASDLYEVERLTLSFHARETAAWDVLNAMARSPTFMAIADIRMENTLAATAVLGKKTALAPLGGGDRASTNVALQYPSHDERVVAGRELVSVSLVVDLYHFKQAFSPEAAP